MNKDFTCGKCADWCNRSPDDPDLTCTHSADNCYSSDETCDIFDSDGKTCLKCDDDDYYYSLDDGKCYHYISLIGYDGKAYGCYSFDVVEDFDINFKSYEPVDGVCENPFTNEDKGTGIVIVSILLVALLLL
ncbi:hypothetical protein QTN25_007803 [Entamoeba marina]